MFSLRYFPPRCHDAVGLSHHATTYWALLITVYAGSVPAQTSLRYSAGKIIALTKTGAYLPTKTGVR